MGRLSVPIDLKHDMWSYLVLYSVKWEFSLYCYMFKKCEGWVCPSMSVVAKHDIWIYLLLNLVNIKYWDDPWRKKEILPNMVANLVNRKVQIVSWFKLWNVNIFCFVFGKMKVVECFLSRKRDISIFGKFYIWEGWVCLLI